MSSDNSAFWLRLPPSLMEAARSAANREGISLNKYLMLCVARCVDPIDFKRAYMRQHAPDDAEVLQLLSKGGNEPPRPDDELPPGVTLEQAIRGK